jgi:DNA-binding transcriptional MerR regulator
VLPIGAFARIGQVTHRMLRHWDTAGLLVPAHVDEFTGYRSYDPSQLARLHRIVALRQLGFGLDDIAAALADGVDTGRLAVLLRERRNGVAREHALATAQLADVGRRLRLIEEEKTMSTIEMITKDLPAVRLAARSTTVAEQPQVGAVVGPLFDAVAKTLTDAHGPGLLEVPIAQYDMGEDGVSVVCGFEYDGERLEGQLAACAIHLGPMDGISRSWMALMTEAAERGLTPSGPGRELYVRAEREDQADWVTELQQPVARA